MQRAVQRLGVWIVGGFVMAGWSASAETPAAATNQEMAVTTNAPAKAQTKCPVTGDPIDKKIYVDVEGYRVYLCCLDCARKIKADPAKYLKKITDAGEQPEALKKKTGGGTADTNTAAHAHSAHEHAAEHPATTTHPSSGGHQHSGHQH